MKVLHVSTRDTGGAGRACLRLHQGLLELGVESAVLLRDKALAAPGTHRFGLPRPPLRTRAWLKARRILSEFGLCRYPAYEPHADDLAGRPSGFDTFSFPDSDYDVTTHPLYREADVIHLHWVAGFVDLPSFFAKADKPVVWTLHDMNPFTGGCHYAGDCKGFRGHCSDCPQLAPSKRGRAEESLRLKAGVMQSAQRVPVLVAPSRWLQEQAAQSAVFRGTKTRLIPYGVDTSLFRPMDRSHAREALGIRDDGRPVILFVAETVGNRRKGLHLLREAVTRHLSEFDVLLATVGAASPVQSDDVKLLKDLGRIQDDRLMRLAYCAADVYVASSIEDNLPNTVIEALACGTPVVAFPIGGMPDMVIPGRNGSLARTVSAADLGDAIGQGIALSQEVSSEKTGGEARAEYSLRHQAEACQAIYNEALGSP